MVLIVFYGMYPEKIHKQPEKIQKQMSKNQRMVKILLEKSKNACALAALLVFLPHNFLQSLLKRLNKNRIFTCTICAIWKKWNMKRTLLYQFSYCKVWNSVMTWVVTSFDFIVDCFLCSYPDSPLFHQMFVRYIDSIYMQKLWSYLISSTEYIFLFFQ